MLAGQLLRSRHYSDLPDASLSSTVAINPLISTASTSIDARIQKFSPVTHAATPATAAHTTSMTARILRFTLSDGFILDIHIAQFLRPRQHRHQHRKRGSVSQLQQHIERIGQLPKPKQRMIMDMIDAVPP